MRSNSTLIPICPAIGEIDLAINTETAMAVNSMGVKTISIVWPNSVLTRINTGATNNAICKLLPIAISTAAPILFFIASMTAALCSAALPTIAIRNAPTNTSDRPNSAVNAMEGTYKPFTDEGNHNGRQEQEYERDAVWTKRALRHDRALFLLHLQVYPYA